MKKIRKLINVILFFPAAIYVLASRRAYYVTGTFMDKDGKRMFFKTTFVTHSGIMPIASLEANMAKAFGVEKTIILFFHRIPYRMVKYVDANYHDSIEVKIRDANKTIGR